MKTYGGRRSIAQLILNLGARWRLGVSITPWPLYHQEGSLVPIEYAAGLAPEAVWTIWIRGDHPARSLVSIPRRLSRLQT